MVAPAADLRLLETTLQQLPVGVLVCDAAGRVLLRNQQLSRIWRREVDWSQLAQAAPGELAIVRGDGTDAWVLVGAVALDGARLVTFEDITEHKRAERR